jgi:hypothetical protein
MELGLIIVAGFFAWTLCGIAVMLALKALLGFDTREVDGMDFLPIALWPVFLACVLTIGLAKLVVFFIGSIHHETR